MEVRLLIAMLIAMFIGVSGSTELKAGDIEGTIIIKHTLTKRKVTASASAYDRGAAVELGADPAGEDPLGYERSHVVIYLEDPASGGEATAVMAQKNRRFAPDLVIIPAGSSVSFPNEDPIFHNVFSLSKPKSFDLGNFPRGQTRTLKFPKAGVVLVNCYLHTNMTGVIVVTPNQWNARSDAAGHFTIRNAPPGKHTLVAWHKAAGFFRQTVEINNSRVTNAEFFVPLDENGLPATQALTVR